MERMKINYVRNAIDLTVGKTGYPALGKYLVEADIATKKELKALERKGLVKSLHVRHKGTIYKSYYTERNVPEMVKESQRKALTEHDKKVEEQLTR